MPAKKQLWELFQNNVVTSVQNTIEQMMEAWECDRAYAASSLIEHILLEVDAKIPEGEKDEFVTNLCKMMGGHFVLPEREKNRE